MAFECLIKSKITAEEWAELLNDGWETRHVVIHEPMEAAHLIAAAYIRASPVLVSVAMTRTMEDRKAVIDSVAAPVVIDADGYYILLVAVVKDYLYKNGLKLFNKFGEYYVVQPIHPKGSEWLPGIDKMFIGLPAAVEFALQHVADKLAGSKSDTAEE